MSSDWTRRGILYTCLGLAQAVHSMEEMATHLYEFFWTATGLLHQHLPVFPQFKISGELFAVLNFGWVAIYLATVLAVDKGTRWGLLFAWGWGVIEISNGLLHLGGVLIFGRYVPGAVTAPLLLVLGILLLRQLILERRTAA
jgi:hypothetical protein